MKTDTQYLTNAWYVAAMSKEVGPEALFQRKLLGQSVMIYRKADGTPVAVSNRCPHRFAPLHLGKRIGDEVACPYHALRFNGEGMCTHNPHGNGHLPKSARLDSYPLMERYGFLWIWMGEAAADPALLPDYGELERGHPNAVAETYMHMEVNYQLILDNVMDLSHVDHVHGEAITTRGQLSPLVPRVQETPRSVAARWEWEQTPPMLIFADFLPEPAASARHFIEVTWVPPGQIELNVGAVQGDRSFDEAIGQYDLHAVTPESEFKTHYFFATRRNHAVEDAEFNAFKIKAMHDAFENEDGPIIKAVQDEMGTADFFSLNPVLMSNDIAAVRMRKLLHRLIQQEHGQAAPAPRADLQPVTA
jgi:vanillate O-demethylase monooxygenase subunit